MLQPLELGDYQNVIGGQDIEFEGHTSIKIKVGNDKSPVQAETGGKLTVSGRTTRKKLVENVTNAAKTLANHTKDTVLILGPTILSGSTP